MYLKKLHLHQFKNYETAELSFGPGINALLGTNGTGKTNLLDAVYYLSLTKSAFNPIDQQNIMHNLDMFVLRGEFETGKKKQEVVCHVQQGQKKVFKVDKSAYLKVSEHIGLIPVVMIAPHDAEIIMEGSEIRRKFFDSIVSQYDKPYLDCLLDYANALRQRNSLLKIFAEQNRFDKAQMEPWNRKLLQLGKVLHESRKTLIEEFLPLFLEHYAQLSEGREDVNISYYSDWFEKDHIQLFEQNIKQDLGLRRSAMGAHKDEFEFLIGGYPLKKFGSQGQQKSFLIALKLAQFDLIKQKSGKIPILLLDDIFDKLDDRRIARLIALASGEAFGQLFITDARPERTLGILEQIPLKHCVYLLNNGEIQKLS
jgi:DNA replication and repair protein RecF